MEAELTVSDVQAFTDKVLDNLRMVIVGKDEALEMVVVGLLCQGHILIEDVPGVGKTVLARSLARSLGVAFSRIQFTPDMLPSDVTGVSIFNQQTRQFEFREGPIVAQIVLADEINRATPKTQSALLEAMEERQVTVDGITHPLPSPFLVMGTQNPIEYEGTFPLPEAQLDRFLLRIHLGYPALEDEVKILSDQQYAHPINSISSVVTQEELQRMQEAVRRVYVSPAVKRYIVEMTRATRENQDITWAQARAAAWGCSGPGRRAPPLPGRDYVLPDDIKTWLRTCWPTALSPTRLPV
jgi:MoxR-like ATPase